MDMSRLNDAQQLIMKYYTQIVDIIKPHIEKQLEHAYEVKTIKQQTASLNRGITYGETKIIKLQKYIDNAKKEKIEMENKLAEYQKK
jgi:predicted  nucleic acid-binding Zn-ribbon protein